MGGGLGTAYDVHLGLIRKRVVDFLLVLIELFSLGVTVEALRAYIGSSRRFRSNGGWLTQNFRQNVPHQPAFSLKTRLNGLSYGIKIWTDFSSVLSQFTRLTYGRRDRRTDRIFIARPRLHSMQRGKNCDNIQMCIAMQVAAV